MNAEPSWAPGVAKVYEVPEQTNIFDGERWECGVHKGFSAVEFGKLILDSKRHRPLRLFDTFAGRPPSGPHDGSHGSAFENTSPELVRERLPLPFVSLHQGVIPESFAGLEGSRIAFAYIDLDLYEGTRSALEFVLPRLVPGGQLVVDDYSARGVWPGVSMAVDEILPSVQRVGKRAVLYRKPRFEEAVAAWG